MVAADDVVHLCRRAGFGATPREIRQLAKARNRRALVRIVLDDRRAVGRVRYAPRPQSFSPPSCNTADAYHETIALGRWWLERMRNARWISRTRGVDTRPHPLREKMTLFWHGMLVSSLRKGLVYCHHQTLWKQNRRFRRRALGGYEGVLTDVALGPAMLFYLDNYASTAANPNENFARELLELISVGVGNFTQDDVFAAARAGTGYSVSADRLAHRFYPSNHDYGPKTFFGITDNWDLAGQAGGSSRNLIAHLTDPRRGEGMTTARTVGKLLWEYFAHFQPDAAIVDQVASAFAKSGRLVVKDALRAIFKHPEFWGSQARQGKVKNPVEWSVAMLRGLGLPPVYLQQYQWDATQVTMGDMGLQLFFPPNVFGWWRRPEQRWVHVPGFQAKALSSAVMAQMIIQDPGSRPWAWIAGTSAEAVHAAYLRCTGVRLGPASPVRASAIGLRDDSRALGVTAEAQIVQLIRFVALSPPTQVN